MVPRVKTSFVAQPVVNFSPPQKKNSSSKDANGRNSLNHAKTFVKKLQTRSQKDNLCPDE
jgi:hypothetical protein